MNQATREADAPSAERRGYGPWHVGVRQADVIVYDAKGWAVANATVYHGKADREESKANARLIAAAPELAETLRRLLVETDQHATGTCDNLRAVCSTARALLARVNS